MTTRIRDFLRSRNDDGPCLVVDLDVVRDNYQTFARAIPDSRLRKEQVSLLSIATGSRRRNRRTPLSNGGRGLKQRRSGLFWSRWPSKGQHRRGLSILSCRPCGTGLPLQSKAAVPAQEPLL